MDEKLPIISIDLEDWNHGLHEHDTRHTSALVVVNYLLPLLKQHDITAIFYVLGRFKEEHPWVVKEIAQDGHVLKSHGYWHDWGEPADRSPYFSNGDCPGLSGGFLFRLLPLWATKAALKRSGDLFLHPHDLDENHPHCRNPLYNIKRHIGLKTARKKLERLLEEVNFGEPS